MSDKTLFQSLREMRQQRVRVALQPGQRHDVPNPRDPGKFMSITDPMIGTEPIVFEICSVSANQVIDADRMITEQPPALYQDEPSPSRVGTVRVLKGYDMEDPKYLAARQAQLPRRDAAICLFGCPDLESTTPGSNLGEKIDTLMRDIPGLLIEWLCREVETISIITAVGEKEVASFLAEGSGTSPDSGGSKSRSQAGGKNKRSTGSTAPTSPTSKGKRPASGEG